MPAMRQASRDRRRTERQVRQGEDLRPPTRGKVRLPSDGRHRRERQSERVRRPRFPSPFSLLTFTHFQRCSTLPRRVCPEVHLPAPETRTGPPAAALFLSATLRTIFRLASGGAEDPACRWEREEKCVIVPVNACKVREVCEELKPEENNADDADCGDCLEACRYVPNFPCLRHCQDPAANVLDADNGLH